MVLRDVAMVKRRIMIMIMTMMTMMMTILIANNESRSEHKEMLSTGGKNG